MSSDRILSWSQLVSKGVTYCRQHVGRLEAAGEFPQRVQIGANRIGWFESEVDTWLASRARGPLPKLPQLRPRPRPAPEPDPRDLEALHRLLAKFGLEAVPVAKQRRREGRSPP